MASKRNLKIVGHTEDNKYVISGKGVFKLTESRGIPLDVILEKVDEYDYVIDWISFYHEGRYRALWKIETIMKKISDALYDIHGDEYRDEVVKRLKNYIANEEKYNK